MNKQQLASKIWASANKMRSKIEANEYKDYILGFIFYKFLSDKEIKYVRSQGGTDEDIRALSENDHETMVNIQNNIGYFIAYDNLFSTWIDKGKDFDVSNVRDGLNAFSRLINPTHKKVFDNILDTLQSGLSKLGDSSNTQTKAISDLIQLIRVIPMDGKQDYDVLGFIYEYLISMFAANAGKKAGEFYTPHEVSMLMSEIVADHVKGRSEIKIYDPTSGSGSLLINIGRSVAKRVNDENNIKYYAQELKGNTYNLTRMNLVMRGILPHNIVTRNGDTLEDDWPFFDESDPVGTYDPLFVDAVVSNPPYSQAWDPANKEQDARFAAFGLAPKGKADYAFLLHDLFHLRPDGIMTIVLPHGVLFRGNEEGTIRKNLIEHNHIDAIIGLPANIFFGTSISTIIMVLKKKRSTNDVLIVDASRGFEKVGKNNVLRASDIKKISDTVIGRLNINGFSRTVGQDEIRSNDYNLNIPRYVDSSDDAETWDVYASMFGGIPNSEIADYENYWNAFGGLRSRLFADNGTPYSDLKVDDIDSSIRNDQSVMDWRKRYDSAFDGLSDRLCKDLVDGWESVDINKEESLISDDIFSRLDGVDLVDRYQVYQVLDDVWVKIAADLEMLQTEGASAFRKVDPNLVLKKKDGKEQEVQEGWAGRVVPFDLVQSMLLKDEIVALKEKRDRLAEIQSTYEEIIDSMSEEDKSSEILNDEGDAFVAAEVTKMVKSTFGSMSKARSAVLSYDEESLERKVVRVQDLIDEEKVLKKQVKSDGIALHNKTKATIEGLTDDQVCAVLKLKWISPITEAIGNIPDGIIGNLVTSVKALSDKYDTTYAEVSEEIFKVESELVNMIDELIGSEYDTKGLREFQSLLRGDRK